MKLVKKDRQIWLLVFEIKNEKLANILTKKKKLVLEDTLYKYIRYNTFYKIK